MTSFQHNSSLIANQYDITQVRADWWHVSYTILTSGAPDLFPQIKLVPVQGSDCSDRRTLEVSCLVQIS